MDRTIKTAKIPTEIIKHNKLILQRFSLSMSFINFIFKIARKNF